MIAVSLPQEKVIIDTPPKRYLILYWWIGGMGTVVTDNWDSMDNLEHALEKAMNYCVEPWFHAMVCDGTNVLFRK